MIKSCVECGCEFEARDNRNILCSDECRRNRVNAKLRKERAADREERKGSGTKRSLPKFSIDKVMELAGELGVDYGKAVALIASGKIKEV